MRHLKIYICTMLFWGNTVSSPAQQPVCAAATRETGRLFSYLLNKHHGRLLGHQEDPAYGIDCRNFDHCSDVFLATGRMPAVTGWEMGGIETGQASNINGVPFSQIKTAIQEAYHAGGIITLSWHCTNPVTNGDAWDNKRPEVIGEILYNARYEKVFEGYLMQLSGFINSLKDTANRPIPVILRPFHEMNGSWFWWNTHLNTTAAFRMLFRKTVLFLQKQHCDNVLYAYTPDIFQNTTEYLSAYPGDKYVDILGVDSYQQNIADSTRFMKDTEKALQIIGRLCLVRHKIPVLSETGLENIPAQKWWSHILGPLLTRNQVAYFLLWRNAGMQTQHGQLSYYVPTPAMPSYQDFILFLQQYKIRLADPLAVDEIYR